MKRYFFISLGLALLGLCLIGGGRFVENHPLFCNSCHEMNRPYEGWKSSGASTSHPNCMNCHSGKGFYGIVEAETRGFGQLVEHFILSEKELKGPFIANVPRQFCLKCHNLNLPRTAKAHVPFDIDGKECSRCHKHKTGWEFSGEIRAEN
jgi:nitrate/TMAO reductase-like tetraheme cytochrome c subunit